MSDRREPGQLIHRVWRDTMLSQGRPVAPERMQWDTLSEQDRELDAAIEAEARAQADSAPLDVRRILEWAAAQPLTWDWACVECRPNSDMLVVGFLCAIHAARALTYAGAAAPPAGAAAPPEGTALGTDEVWGR